MSRFWNQRTRKLQPYVPGEQPAVPDLIKLNTNEHPLQPANSVLQAIAELESEPLRRYPDPLSSRLREAIAAHAGVEMDQIHVGNGSDEVLGMLFMGLLEPGSTVSIPDITYSFYSVWAALCDITINYVPLLDDFSVDVYALCDTGSTVVLANPNAPTGIAVTLDDIERLLTSQPDRLVVVDEAYFGFGAESATPLIPSFDNLIITRTLSKSHALAGLRVGYALAQAPLIEGLVRIKDSFNSYPIDAIAQRLATAALSDDQWFAESGDVVTSLREALASALRDRGFTVLPSKANFLFVSHPLHAGNRIFDALRAHNILVRRWNQPRIDSWLRITVGTAEQHDVLLKTLDEVLGNAADSP